MSKKEYGNKKVADAIKAARGERSLRRYAADTGVNYITIYRIEKGESLPSPQTIKKLTTGAARPRNDVSYDDVMIAAGYQQNKNKEIEAMVDERAAEIAASDKILKSQKLIYSGGDYIRFRHYGFGLISSAISNNENLKIKGINYPMYSVNNRELDMKVWLDDNKVDEWWFDFRHFVPDTRRSFDSYAFGTFGRLVLLNPDPKRKISIVYDNPEIFSFMKGRAYGISYKGDLSVILVDVKEGMIVEETYIAHYNDEVDSEFYIL